MSTIQERLAKIQKRASGETEAESPLETLVKAEIAAVSAGLVAARESIAATVQKAEQPNEEHVTIVKNLAAAEAKLAAIGASLNIDAKDDDFPWKVSSALRKLREYADLMRLLGETGLYKAEEEGGEAPAAAAPPEAPAPAPAAPTPTAKAEAPAPAPKGWPLDLTKSEIRDGRLVPTAKSIWGQDPTPPKG